MASSEVRRPKSANPNRRLRTATHKVTGPRTRPDLSLYQQQSSSFDSVEDPCFLDPQVPCPSPLETEPNGHHANCTRRLSAGVLQQQQQQQTPSPTYDSMMTFECIQKASALRVLAKTLDRQRDVMQASTGNPNAPIVLDPASLTTGSSSPTELPYRKLSTPPRKLRPLEREIGESF